VVEVVSFRDLLVPPVSKLDRITCLVVQESDFSIILLYLTSVRQLESKMFGVEGN